MAQADDGIVWKAHDREEIQEDDAADVWDDTALIKAYDRAVEKLRNELHRESCGETDEASHVKTKKRKKKNRSRNKQQEKIKTSWQAGEKCLAIFSEDQLYYEATILYIDENLGTAYVRYEYYGNEEQTNIGDLLPVERKVDMEPYGGVCESEQSVYTEEEDDQKSSDVNKKLPNNRSSKVKEAANWRVSDLCYVLDDVGTYQQAVLNSFISESQCNITFVLSKRKKKVEISQLRSTIPIKKVPTSQSPWPHSPWPMTMFSPQDFFPQSSYDVLGSSGAFPRIHPGFPTFPLHFLDESRPFYRSHPISKTFPTPPPPPPPFTLEGVVDGGDEESLANMLMSWYMSGYHTGYYRGITQQQQQQQQSSPSTNTRRQKRP